MTTLSKRDRAVRRVGYKLAVLAASAAAFGLAAGAVYGSKATRTLARLAC